MKLSFCPSLKLYRDVMLLTCAVFPTASKTVALNWDAVVATVVLASITLDT